MHKFYFISPVMRRGGPSLQREVKRRIEEGPGKDFEFSLHLCNPQHGKESRTCKRRESAWKASEKALPLKNGNYSLQ